MRKSSDLTREQIIDLLNYIGVDKIIDRPNRDNIQMCCPIHGESNPSSGISVEKQVFNCFSCHFRGSIPYFLFKACDDFKNLKEAEEFLEERYGVEYAEIDRSITRGLRRYGEEIECEEKRFELPKYELAPFKSGKTTYKYILDRGFTKKTVKEYMLGKDEDNKTVTIPLFWSDNVLAGIVGRYIDPNRPHNQRYKIYKCPTGNILYPLHTFKPKDTTVVIVEGILDGLWLRQNNINYGLATMTNHISNEQLRILTEDYNIDTIIDMSDNDDMGEKFSAYLKRVCKRRGLNYLTCKHLYPSGKKDPQECTKEELLTMINGAKSSLHKRLKKID